MIIATITLNILIIVKSKQPEQNGTEVQVSTKLKVSTKALVISAISIIAIGIVALGITSFAHNSETLDLINKLDNKEYWLNSEKYLVTDESVSRIAPLTNIQDITDKFNKEIEIYKENSNDKVTDGLVKSGMRISDKESSYDISVLGDINGDGESNHIELTNIIRNIVNLEKYKFNNLEKLSADMNIDKVIDQGDVNTSVKYILYGELDIPGFDQVKEPKIEVVGGKIFDKIDAYEDTIQVKITKQDENATKTKYKIEGTEEKQYTEIENGEIVELPNNGVYKISAYSYGKLGNRSEVPYEILIKKNPNNKYKIITRTENEDGTYEETVEEKEGRIGEKVTINNEVPDGYEINEEKSTMTGEIPEEEIIELVVTYDRKEYTLTLEAGDYISSVKMGDESNTTISKKFKFGKTVNISAEVEKIAGNDISWKEWVSSDASILENMQVKDTSMKMPKSDITLTATTNRALTEYTINYDLKGGNLLEGKTNPTSYTVETEDFTLNNPVKQGYRFTGWTGTDLTETNESGETVDKLTEQVTIRKGSTGNRTYTANWEAIEYTITYNLDGGNLLEGKTNPEKYTIETESFTLNNPIKEGYKFLGWTGTDLLAETEAVTVATGSIGDRNYVANWQANTETKYHVQYYLEKLDSTDKNNADNYFLQENQELSGITNAPVTAEIKEFTGFTYDEENPNNYVSGNIAGDESLILKVYYTRNSYTLTLQKDENVENVTGNKVDANTLKGTYKYEEQAQINATLKQITGYTITFNEWVSADTKLLRNQPNKEANFTMPAGDITLTATSTKTADTVKYTVEYYYQEQGFYKNDTKDKKEKSAVTGTEVEVDDIDKKETKEGYVLDESKKENWKGTVQGNGELVLKVYFKEQFTVTYKPGTKGTFEKQQTENIDWGTQTPVFNGELTHQEGYEFNGWDKTLADKVTENIEYTATWKAKEYNIVYTLNGGSLGTDNNGNEITNKASYNIETESFTLNNPGREGYEFKGWTGTDLNAESKNVTIEKGSVGDRTYTANWTAIDYTITYELNGGDLGSDESGNKITNPKTYNIETPDFELNNPKRIGYTFIGWTGTDLAEETTLVIVRNGSTGNRNYEANWQVNTNVEYKVKYYKEKLESQDSTNKDNYELEEEKTHFGTTDQSITLDVDENKYKGFTYSPEISTVSGTIRGDGKLVLEVYYSRNSYTLKLEKDENVNRVEGSSIEKNLGISIDEATGEAIFKYEQPIEINADLKTEDGYDITFIKWESNNTDLLDDKFNKNTSFEMPAGNLTLKATSNKIAKNVGYTVKFYYQVNGTYSDTPDYIDSSRKAETDVEVFVTEDDKKPNSERQGYTFDETKNGNLSGRVKGNETLVLKVYFKQQFTVTYKSGEHGTFKYEQEEKTEEKYEKLDYNSQTPNLTGTLTAQKGYEFVNWNKEIADKVTENSEYIANWNAIEYNISYNLNGGDLGLDNSGNAITNPTSYTVETEDFTLNNPTRKGYIFKGWTGTDLTETNDQGETVDKLTEQVTIKKGSTGDREYTANWEILEYKITYNLDGGKLLEGASNPEKYTVDTETFTLNNPIKTGYEFLGWTGTELTETNDKGETVDKLTEQVTIEKGSTGDREYTANWNENTDTKYHVQYYLEKLESTDKNNTDNYYLQEVAEKSGTTNTPVNAEIKEYTGFTYYEAISTVSGNIAGDESLVLKVYYTRNSYKLKLEKDENIDGVEGKSINKNEGISVDKITGEATFKYEQPIEINSTLKDVEGYEVTFKEWESSSEQVLNTKEEKEKQKTTFTMPAEDVTVKATSNIEAKTVEYTVEYYYEGDDGYPQTATYTNEDPRTAKVGETVGIKESDQIPDSRKPGYEYDSENEKNVLEAQIPTTGTAVLKLYFKKATYTLTIVAGDGITGIQLGDQTAEANGILTGTYKYGDSITIDASYGEEDGYTIEFEKWQSNSQKLMADNTTKNLTFTMPAGDLTLTAVANKVAKDSSYSVAYYYQKNGEYPDKENPDDIVVRSGKTGEQVSITLADQAPIKEGYAYDDEAEGKIERTDEDGIAADGSTTLRVYFKEQFTVTYKPGEYGTFADKIINKIDYNANIPEYTGNLDGNNGYVFDTWKLTKIGDTEVTEETEIPSTVTANLEYTAQWKAMPIPTVTHRPTEWTNQNVTVNITAKEAGYTIEYRIDDNTNWEVYEGEFEIEQNCVIHARLAKETNKGEEVDHEINNIDKIRPQFGEKTVNTEKNDEATIKVKATDNLSGIVEYGITKEGYAGSKTYTCENTTDTELTFNEIYENGIYTMYLKDAAGNTSEDIIEITNITGFKVARIVSAPVGYEHLIGTEYETLQSALETSDEAAQIGNVKIEIIHNIYNETNTVQNGRDYTINLNNYYVKNQEAKTTLTVDGKLQIVDENKLGTGTVSSPFGRGIYITKNGELTLGEDEGGIPSTFSPIVEGQTYGIEKEIDDKAEKVYDEKTEKYYYPEGVFNFYDGKIIGGTGSFLVQRVNDTPALYDPTVVTNTGTKKQEATLNVVSGIEAVIGKKRYMLLEEAIADANNVIGDSNTQVEITIVKDLAKDAEHKVVVDNTKNIKLDLNGHVFTTTANDYVLENYGKLEIYDSSDVEEVLDLTKAVERGDYHFDIREGGGLISNNAGIHNSTAHSVLELDLTKKTGNVEITTDVTISSESNSDYGYITVRTDDQVVDYDNTDGRKVLISGNERRETKFELDGGKKYYIQFGYYKDINMSGNDDCFIINDIRITGKGKITNSTNSTILNGISSTSTKEIAYEDIDLSKAAQKGDYYFDTRAEGGLVSNNTGIHNSTAHSVVELDLTGKEGIYEVVTNVTISSQERNDYGYITVRSDNKIVEYNNTDGRKVYVSGASEDEEHKFYLAGGEKYYIQFGYYKNNSGNKFNDCFIIKNMKYGKKESAGELTITSGTYECTKKGTNSFDGYTSAIQNESMLYINGGEIKATLDYSVGIYNGKSENSANLVINDGKINTYYYSVLNRGLSKINGGKLYSSGSSSGYSCVMNDGNLYVLGEDVNISGNTNGVITKNSGNTTINAGTIYGKSTGINNYDNESTTIINGGNVSGDSYGIYNERKGKIKIENVNITSATHGIHNRSEGVIEINNIEMASVNSSGEPTVDYGLYNYGSGKIIFNNGEIYSKFHAVDNRISGTIEMNGGKLRTYSSDFSTVINSNDGGNGTFKITGGTITGPANAIYNLNKGNVIITGGTIETTKQSVAIYNNDINGIVTIGSNDENVSTVSPVIKSAGSNAVSNKLGTFNFYDGVLIGNENYVIAGMLTDIPEEYELVKELKEDGLQYVTLGIQANYVAKISELENPDVSMLDEAYYKLEDGYYYFITLNSAVKACSKTNASTIELIDNPWIYRTITVDEAQNITIKFNGKTMYLKAPLNFENNGKIKFINENAENISEEERTYGEIKANGGLLIKNNENAEMNLDSISVSYESSQGSSSNLRKLIDNYGKLNIENSKYYTYCSGQNTMYVYDIYNEETGVLNIDNINISGNGINPIVNVGKDKINEENTTYSAIIKNSTMSHTGYPHGFFNDGEGTMLIENSTIRSYYENRNNSSGNLIIRNSTIYSNNTMYNNSTGYIEIDNSTINCTTNNKSSGKILIKGADSKLSQIVNNNVDGTVEMQAGQVNSGVGINNYGKLIVSGGEVVGSGSNTSKGINNNSSGTAIIRGKETKITSSGYGIYNQGTVTVESGIVKGNGNSGIYNTKELTLGIKEGTVNYNPTVYGKTNGVYNTGTFNFYDGIIEGNETKSIAGKIPSETEEDSLRVIHKGECTFSDGTEEGYNVLSGREISVLEKVNIAYVVSKNKYYSSLESALADTEDTDTIKIVHDVSINGTVPSLDIQEGKNITLDLNSYNIVAGNDKTIINNGTLRIIDSTSHEDDGGNIIEGTFVNGANTILENNGTATIENGSYELTIGGSKDNYYNMFINAGTLNLNSKGPYKAKGTYSRIIYNTTGTSLVKDGILEATQSNSTTIWNDTGIVTVENGTIKGNEHSVYNYENGEINIKNGTISNNVYNKSEGTINISAGNINSYVENEGQGTINISGGTINYASSYSTIKNTGTGTINITGGSIKGSATGVNNNSTGIVNIDGTSLSNENPIEIVGRYSSHNCYGIYNYSSGIVNIKGHVNINASAGSSYTAYGIYNVSTGIINIGDSENPTNNVKISSTDYGVCNYTGAHGTINYYGGTITSPTAVRGYIDEIPENYDIVKSIDDSNKEIYEIGNMQNIVSVGETKYNTLEDAISSNDSGTITLLKDIVLTTSEKQTISDNKNFILDLNGYTIKLHNWETFITNYGTLKITDNTEAQNGKIYGYTGTAIKNEGDFEMAGGTIEINQNENQKIIHNVGNGKIKITGGTLKDIARTYNSSYYNIYNESSEDMNITGGTIYTYKQFHDTRWSTDSTMYSVYCTKNININMTGGIIQGRKQGGDDTEHGFYMTEKANLNISGSAQLKSDYNINFRFGGKIDISENADISDSSYSIYANYSDKDNLEINIKGGTVKNIYANVSKNSSSTVNLTGGNVIGTISNCSNVEVYEGVNFNVSGDAIYSCTNVNIHNATIVGNVYNPTVLNMIGGSITGTSYGIQLNNKSSVATITGGTVSATEGPGILISYGTLNLGVDDGEYPSTEIPAITGSTYGVKNDGGTFNFYDGILTGKTHATSGTVTNIPERFKTLYSEDGTVAVLGIEAVFEQVATVNGVFYNNLESAIDAAIKVNGKVELCKDITTVNNITIPAGITVTIDLLGFSINGYTETGALFTNNGTLIIEDSTNDGTNQSTVRSYTGTVIVNNGTLTIGTNDNIVHTNAPKIIGKTVAIENNGELYFYDGQIGVSEGEGDVIINTGTGYRPEGYRFVKLEGTNTYILVQ